MQISEERKQFYCQEHDRLSQLFRQDRLGFERERKRLIQETIDSYRNGRTRANLTELQREWDKVLNKAGSSQNRFVLMKTMFWSQVINQWLPMLQSFQQMEIRHQPRPPAAVPLRRIK